MQIINEPKDKHTSSEEEQEQWSDSYLVDNLKQHLATLVIIKIQNSNRFT